MERLTSSTADLDNVMTILVDNYIRGDPKVSDEKFLESVRFINNETTRTDSAVLEASVPLKDKATKTTAMRKSSKVKAAGVVVDVSVVTDAVNAVSGPRPPRARGKLYASRLLHRTPLPLFLLLLLCLRSSLNHQLRLHRSANRRSRPVERLLCVLVLLPRRRLYRRQHYVGMRCKYE